MKTIGAFAAKTHFSQLLAEVARGGKIAITLHGHKVAMLTPLTDEESENPMRKLAAAAIKNIRTLRKGVTLGKNLTIRGMREEGRK